MGQIVIAAFKPKPGRESDLLSVIDDRLPLLRRLGLATERENITMRAADGTILDVSEWVDDDAIGRAHSTPEVLKHWQRYEECCEYVRLNAVPEVGMDFATFEAVR